MIFKFGMKNLEILNETNYFIMQNKHWDQEFINQLVSNNFHVIRFDNRDVGN